MRAFSASPRSQRPRRPSVTPFARFFPPLSRVTACPPVFPRSPCTLRGLGALAPVRRIRRPGPAAFLEDGSARLEARRLLQPRLRDGSSANPQGASKREEAAQASSSTCARLYRGRAGLRRGYPGDARDRLRPADSNSGLLPSSGHDPRRSVDQYAKAGVAGKMRFSQT